MTELTMENSRVFSGGNDARKRAEGYAKIYRGEAYMIDELTDTWADKVRKAHGLDEGNRSMTYLRIYYPWVVLPEDKA